MKRAARKSASTLIRVNDDICFFSYYKIQRFVARVVLIGRVSISKHLWYYLTINSFKIGVGDCFYIINSITVATCCIPVLNTSLVGKYKYFVSLYGDNYSTFLEYYLRELLLVKSVNKWKVFAKNVNHLWENTLLFVAISIHIKWTLDTNLIIYLL